MPKKTVFKVEGVDLINKVRSLVKEGNVRRIVIKNEEGKVYLEIPVNVGILGLLFAPILIAVGTIAAMATSFTIEVIRKEPSPARPKDGRSDGKAPKSTKKK